MVLYGLLVAMTGACAHRALPTPAAGGPSVSPPPDLVAVVPFSSWKKQDATQPRGEEDSTRVPLVVEVNGRRGVFLLDLGCPWVNVEPGFLTFGPSSLVMSASLARIQLRIGTVLDSFADPHLEMAEHLPPHAANARVRHFLDPEYYADGRAVGNIGLAALEPFETIIDYTHQRVLLIRLDAAGHRLVDVPAYTPAWSAPLIDVGNQWWGLQASLNGVPKVWVFDTGFGVNIINPSETSVTTKWVDTDSLVFAGRRVHAKLRVFSSGFGVNVLGYPFLRQLGVVGFNHRTHQFLLYR